MSRRCIAVLFVLLPLVVSGCWAEDGFFGARTGNNTFETTLTPDSVIRLGAVWNTLVPGGHPFGHVFTDGLRVYQVKFGTAHSNWITDAYDVSTGALVWSTPMDFQATQGLTVAGGRVIVPTVDASTAEVVTEELDSATGQLLFENRISGSFSHAGSPVFDGRTVAMAVHTLNGTSQLWYGTVSDPSSSSFTHMDIIPTAPPPTSPAINGNAMVVAAGDQLFTFEISSDPAVCTVFVPCGPATASVHHTNVSPADQTLAEDYPVIIGNNRIGLGTTEGHLLITDAVGTPVWQGTSSIAGAVTPPAVAPPFLFTTAQNDGRIYAYPSDDCRAGGLHLLPTCAAVKVLVNSTSSSFTESQPEVAGNLVYTFSGNLVTVYRTDCTPVRIDAASNLPACDPVTSIPMSSSIEGLAVSGGMIIVSTVDVIQAFMPV